MIYLIGLESRWHQAPTNLLLSLFLGTWSRAFLLYSTFHLFVSPDIICNLNYILEPQGPLPHLTIFPVKKKNCFLHSSKNIYHEKKRISVKTLITNCKAIRSYHLPVNLKMIEKKIRMGQQTIKRQTRKSLCWV